MRSISKGARSISAATTVRRPSRRTAPSSPPRPIIKWSLTGQLVETTCPFTGKPLNAEKTVDVDGVKVAFCCANCQAKAAKMAKAELLKKIFTDVSKCYKLADSK